MEKQNIESELRAKLEKMTKSVDIQNNELQDRYQKMNKLQNQLTDQRTLENLC